MGVSCAEVRGYMMKSLQHVRPKSILDLGCGVGLYGQAIRRALGPTVRLYGVDGFLPFLAGKLAGVYDILVKAQIGEFVAGTVSIKADCVMCMDVVEHFEKPAALELLGWLLKQPLAYMSTPMFEYEQGAVGGNELERHRCWFEFDELVSMGWKPLVKVQWDERGWIGAFNNA